MKRDYVVTVNGVAYTVSVEEGAQAAVGTPAVAPAAAPTAAPVTAAPAAPVAAEAPAPAPVGEAGAITITAPMPGNLLDVRVAVGQQVARGDILVILEAMKMENEIVAPQDGVVATINCRKGDIVNAGDIFLTLN